MPDLPQTQPEVTWAQRSSSTDAERNYLYVDIKAPDVAKSAADLKITSKNVSFTGESKKGVKYHVSLDLYAEIDPENSKVNHNDREVELVLRKKELKEEFWPRLLEVKQRVHFLKTDFDKWVDEDEQDEVPDEDYANNFGDFGGGEGGPGGPGGPGGLGNIDFSKLGGLDPSALGGLDPSALAGLGGQLGGEEGEGAEGEEEEEDMPELEHADDKGEAKSTKIQEVS